MKPLYLAKVGNVRERGQKITFGSNSIEANESVDLLLQVLLSFYF